MLIVGMGKEDVEGRPFFDSPNVFMYFDVYVTISPVCV